MKRVIILATAVLLVMMLFAPVAMAQDMEGTMGTTMMEPTTGTEATDIPDSGGPAILLPAAALLLGSGILTFAVLRRR